MESVATPKEGPVQKHLSHPILGVLVLSALSVVAAPGCSGRYSSPSDPGDGSGRAPRSSEEVTPQTAAEEIVALNKDAETSGHLLARKYFNEGSEVLELYEPSPGNFVVSGAGRPAHNRSEIPAVRGLSGVWALLAAPSQVAPPELAARIADETAHARATIQQAPQAASSQPAAAAPGATRIHKANPVNGISNFCNNGEFDFEFDTLNLNNPFFSIANEGPPLFEPAPMVGTGITGSTTVGVTNNDILEVGLAVCPDTDAATFINDAGTSFNVPAGSFRWNNGLAGWSCGTDFSCLANFVRCTWTQATFSARAFSQCGSVLFNGEEDFCADGGQFHFTTFILPGPSQNGCEF